MAVEVARADHYGGRIGAVGEPPAETRMDSDVHEYSGRSQDPGRLREHRRVAGHVGMGHDRDGAGDGPGPYR